MIVLDDPKYPRMRRDLMRRIAETHSRWMRDCGDLYEMGGLWPHQLEHDMFILLMSELAVLMAKHNISVPKTAAELRNFVKQLKAQNDD